MYVNVKAEGARRGKRSAAQIY